MLEQVYKQLINGLKPMSVSKDDALLLEWRITALSLPKRDNCICGVKIKHNFQIKNIITQEHTIVGSECIEHFNNEDMTRVVKTVKWHKSNTRTASKDILKRSHTIWRDKLNRPLLSKWEYDFMLSIGMKRILTDKQDYKFNQILDKIHKFIAENLIHREV